MRSVLVECDDCGEEQKWRRVRCQHCYLLVCSWCWSHVHQCETSHTSEDCRDKDSLKKPRKLLEQMRKRVLAREALVGVHGA